MEEYHVAPYDEERGTGIVRHALIRVGFHTGQILVCLVINDDSLPHADKLTERLIKIQGMTSVCLNINKKKTNVILGEKVVNLFGPGYLEDKIGEVTFQISPQSFFQVNPSQTEVLYKKHSNLPVLPDRKQCGICIAESERFLCFWHAVQRRFTE